MTEAEEKMYITLWLFNNTGAISWDDVQSAEKGDFNHVVDAVYAYYAYVHREEAGCNAI
jgi:hypothetical protein